MYNIKVISMDTSTIKKLQAIELEILKEFIRLCDDNNLRYYLSYGTCIGMIRHKGFIPWDDDIDVSMPREDYDRLVKIANDKLSDGFFFQNYFTDPRCGLIFGKIRKNGTILSEVYSHHIAMHQGVWIDVFPMDRFPNDPNVRKKFFRNLNFVKNLYIVKCGYRLPPDKQGLITKIAYHISKVVVLFLPLNFIINKLDQLVRKYDRPESKDCIISYYRSTSIPYNLLEEDIILPFEDTMAKTYKNYDYYLSALYGDYMTPPPVEKRNVGGDHYIYEFNENTGKKSDINRG